MRSFVNGTCVLMLLLGSFAARAAGEGAIVQMHAGIPGGTQNLFAIERAKATASKDKSRKDIVVFTGDTVIPQLVDGAGWRSSIMLQNLDSHAVTFEIYFAGDNGRDLEFPIVGYSGGTWMTITLPVFGSVTLESPGTNRALTQGWAFIDTNDRVSGMAVFKARQANGTEQEAVVPIVSQFDTNFLLLYDNLGGYTTSMAIANVNTVATTVEVTIRNDAGTVVRRSTLQMAPLQHQAFSVPETWVETRGGRGSIEFRTVGDQGVGVLGLRFHPSGSFTSFHTLTNVDWLL